MIVEALIGAVWAVAGFALGRIRRRSGERCMLRYGYDWHEMRCWEGAGGHWFSRMPYSGCYSELLPNGDCIGGASQWRPVTSGAAFHFIRKELLP